MKVIAIASAGGHWVELLRLLPAFDGMELIFVSTISSLSSTISGHKFYCVRDASRWNKFRLAMSFFDVFKIILNEKPKVVVSTGAAPGLMGLVAGKILGCKTIWIDSVANADKLSLSGKIALQFADKIYTQWPDLANERIVYAGNILS
jgi:UDP-N-acetylglucosamine:LPS N-acetylglucosamine transferase